MYKIIHQASVVLALVLMLILRYLCICLSACPCLYLSLCLSSCILVLLLLLLLTLTLSLVFILVLIPTYNLMLVTKKYNELDPRFPPPLQGNFHALGIYKAHFMKNPNTASHAPRCPRWAANKLEVTSFSLIRSNFVAYFPRGGRACGNRERRSHLS